MHPPRHLLVVRPWHSAAGRRRHRLLDEAGWAALDRDRDPGRLPDETEGWPMSGGPRVLLAILSQRTSVEGWPYLSGWLGRARMIARR
jgi:hypothetical protein